MKITLRLLMSIVAFGSMGALAQPPAEPLRPPASDGPPLKTTFVRPNAVLVQRETPDPVRSHIGILITHPEHANNFNYFHGMELARYGYTVMLLNYWGPETTYEEFLAPISGAIKKLRAVDGVQKVVISGHSSGGPELSYYENVAENGPAACQQPQRIYKCETKKAQNLEKADGLLLFDPNSGALSRLLGLNPAMDAHDPHKINPALDMFNPKNGYDPATRSGNYSAEWLKQHFAAQAARANQLIDEAQARLTKIEKGEGEFKDDEPFVVAGTSGAGRAGIGAQLTGADLHLLSKTHAPHLLLKADGTQSMQIIPSVAMPSARPEDQDVLTLTTADTTVRHYLSFDALRALPDYHLTEDRIIGVDWQSSGDSMQGSVMGIHVPTLVVAATCWTDFGPLEAVYDNSAAKDKEYVGIEGANHGMRPCRPEFGDTWKRAFDYVDSWLLKSGRFK